MADTSHKELVWIAPSRPYQKRNREYYTTALALAFLLIVIAFFMKEWLIIGSILAIVFVAYALAAVPPDDVEYKITRRGVWVAGTFYKYSEIHEYWFEKQLKSNVLVLLLKKNSTKLVIVLPSNKKNDIESILKDHVTKREKPLKSLVDAISSWVSRNIPLEEKNSHTP